METPFMTTKLTAPYLEQLLAQRANLLEQLNSLRGGTLGRACLLYTSDAADE